MAAAPLHVLRRKAFTLVELLVVIGIIALLIAILLPTLAGAKRKAQAAGCASNERQLYMAMMMFAEDNKGRLPRPYLVGELATNPQVAKVCAIAQRVSNATGHVSVEDNQGGIWKYIKGRNTRAKVLMCPGDTGEFRRGGGGSDDPQYPRNFSYSMHADIRRDGANGSGGVQELGIVLAKVRQPSSRIMIYEELAPNDTWCIMGWNNNVDDVPSGRHGKSMSDSFRDAKTNTEYLGSMGNYCFFDGHVESITVRNLLPNTGKASYHFPLLQGDSATWR